MKQPIPENMILRLKENKEISQAGWLEAEMTFMKIELKKENSEVVYMYPELIHTKEDLFLFAMSYGAHFSALKNGIRNVSKQVKEMFDV